MREVLPDLLDYNLKVVFCGTAAGKQSARAGAYYAGRGNRFWEMLYKTGLTPRQLQPGEYRMLLDYGIGLTDLVKTQYGRDGELDLAEFDPGDLHAKISEYAPRALAFTSKMAARLFFEQPRVKLGLQEDRLGATAVFVLPSPSGAARGTWDELHWYDLAQYIQELDNEG